jgi:hypothetical protein
MQIQGGLEIECTTTQPPHHVAPMSLVQFNNSNLKAWVTSWIEQCKRKRRSFKKYLKTYPWFTLFSISSIFSYSSSSSFFFFFFLSLSLSLFFKLIERINCIIWLQTMKIKKLSFIEKDLWEKRVKYFISIK